MYICDIFIPMIKVVGQDIYYNDKKVDPFEVFDIVDDKDRQRIIEILENIIINERL